MNDNSFPTVLETEGMLRWAADGDEGTVWQWLRRPLLASPPASGLEDATEKRAPLRFEEVQETLGDFRLLREIRARGDRASSSRPSRSRWGGVWR